MAHHLSSSLPMRSRRPLGTLAALGALVVLGTVGRAFLAGRPAPGRTVAAREQRHRVALRAKETNEGYDYTPFGWMVKLGVSDQQYIDVVDRMSNVNSFWPDASKSLAREDFRQRLKASGDLDDVAIDGIFNSFNPSGFVPPDKREELVDAVSSWRSSPGGSVDMFAVQRGIFGARCSVIGAWLFLNVFSVYAGYFVIGRPIIYQLTGIDLLPNLKRFWEG
mmetsp:Transcript_67442/g.152532  ORF Transcript_67442/g.152532 Transcript_67442/m.152532 type:complete len:221 (+) Transcript_67442:26-688(+)|eukprot:CAMPEP_0197916484 /NCGR_PEP_ID=MMETSP1439-20131203/82062_1 /TAXON_ID=66791 /ORGANISM="Gonyaulax spinifera, Strain CCMP409" /LENGTH=220 /DNA_ID=CAMNT_0043538511 /DNA_START=21 /DNA_END=683 /DNA_ORIENTATION=-